jgi:hypothetical protein
MARVGERLYGTQDRRLPFLTLLLPTLVTGRPHEQQFASYFGILLVRAGVSRTIWCDPMTDFCLGIDDLLPVSGSAGHCAIPPA